MRTSILFLFIILAPGAWAQTQDPKVSLEIPALGISLPARVAFTPLEEAEPSCDVLKFRMRYAQKQIDEFAWLAKQPRGLDAKTQKELEGLQRRWLQLGEELSEPWMNLKAEFPLGNLVGSARNRIAQGAYQVHIEAYDRKWDAPPTEMPPAWAMGSNPSVLRFEANLTAIEFCFTPNSVEIEVFLKALKADPNVS